MPAAFWYTGNAASTWTAWAKAAPADRRVHAVADVKSRERIFMVMILGLRE
jgi:hypothetical protein